jgi:murein DD-endopeptidase MepM/ murein hydrolase activator NlpD
VTRLLLFALLGPILALTVAAGSAVPAAQPSATANAYAVKVVVPGQPGASVGELGGPATMTGGAAGFAYPADGSVVRTGASATSVTVRPGADPHIQAASDVVSLSLFNGEITIDGVTMRAVAKAGGTAATAATDGSSVRNLVALGQPVAAGGSAALADWGAVTVLSASSEQTDGETLTGHAVGLGVRVVLTAPHGGLPAGSEILIGFVDATATSPRAAAPAPVTTTPSPRPTAPRPIAEAAAGAARAAADALRRNRGGAPRPDEPGTGETGAPAPPVFRPLPPGINAELTPGRYVFPVYGPVAFGNTFGAPRASTGWHHGEDLFGQLGQPLLAVADGTLFSIGWNDVGGYRLWLRDRYGNQYYYAHLSAFSPLAVNGREVRAGQVIGFMGNTGEAITTPVHLHFEIHPVSLLQFGYDGAIEPYRYLTAWQRLEDVSFAIGQGWVPVLPIRANAPRPGAILLQSADISSASGLDPRSLEQALVAPEALEGDGALQRG